ncbi:MAG: thioredoxin domain-containing protein, partial [Candidatus Harrisonbacteria bacterium]|nr:thioredoxin domain-containing protein [Candidatus Harrisonbacteria bacterium]
MYKKGSSAIVVSIVAVIVLITGAVLLASSDSQKVDESVLPNSQAAGLRPVRESDHVRGNSDAQVSLVEFSDFECPFCARFHPTLSRLVEEYDQVKWVYRHFPLS